MIGQLHNTQLWWLLVHRGTTYVLGLCSIVCSFWVSGWRGKPHWEQQLPPRQRALSLKGAIRGDTRHSSSVPFTKASHMTTSNPKGEVWCYHVLRRRNRNVQRTLATTNAHLITPGGYLQPLQAAHSRKANTSRTSSHFVCAVIPLPWIRGLRNPWLE